MTSPRLVATDLDGTIVRADGTISARTSAALRRVEQAGARFVVLTGRPPRLIDEVARAFGGQGVVMCSNGAIGYDLRLGRVVSEHPIDPDTLREAVRRLRAAIPGIGLAVEYGFELAADQSYESNHWDADIAVHRPGEDVLWNRPAPKLIGRHPTLSADEQVARGRPAVADLVTVVHSNGDRLIEISALGVSKAHALARRAAELGIAADEVVAFGDMPNDLQMLAWAGMSCAVANAHPSVLRTADFIIPASDEDGVAKVIEELFPLPAADCLTTA